MSLLNALSMFSSEIVGTKSGLCAIGPYKPRGSLFFRIEEYSFEIAESSDIFLLSNRLRSRHTNGLGLEQ